MALSPDGTPLPCQNSACKSAGKSHPNCACYPGLAEGGEVGAYCQGPHNSDCEYYAEGGEVTPHHKRGAQIIGEHLAKGLYKGHHDVSDSLIGHSDPSPTVAAVIANGGAPSLLKIGSGGVFDSRVAMKHRQSGERTQKLLAGMGAKEQAHRGPIDASSVEEHLGHPWFDRGMKLQDSLPHMMADAKNTGLHPMVEKLAGRSIDKGAQEFITPVMMRLLAQEANPDEVEHGVHYAEHAAKGIKKVSKAIDGLFSFDTKAEPEESDGRLNKKLHEFVKEGKLLEQAQEELGGQVPEGHEGEPITQGVDPLARHFPEHNTLLQQARARVVGYLNSIRPDQTPALPFDPPMKSKQQEYQYDQALTIAVDPLSILGKVKNGRLTPSQVSAIQTMYPEVYGYLKQEMTSKIAKAQFDKTLIPPTARRSMAVFMGTPLDTTMTPVSIQNVQAMYAKQRAASQQQQADAGSPKKSTSKLDKMAQGAQTDSQALAARQQRPR